MRGDSILRKRVFSVPYLLHTGRVGFSMAFGQSRAVGSLDDTGVCAELQPRSARSGVLLLTESGELVNAGGGIEGGSGGLSSGAVSSTSSLTVASLAVASFAVASFAVASFAVASLAVASFAVASLAVASFAVASLAGLVLAVASLAVASLAIAAGSTTVLGTELLLLANDLRDGDEGLVLLHLLGGRRRGLRGSGGGFLLGLVPGGLDLAGLRQGPQTKGSSELLLLLGLLGSIGSEGLSLDLLQLK